MQTVLRFSDLECVNDTVSGPSGAGLALLARAGYQTARGFVITPKVLRDFLDKEGVSAALIARSGPKRAEGADEVSKAFDAARIPWNHEIEIITALRELDAPVSLTLTSRVGSGVKTSYATGEEAFLAAVKSIWLQWVLKGGDTAEFDALPAVLVREITECVISVELSKRKDGLRARAVFGLPEGLSDSSVTSDIYEFDPSDELTRVEQRAQEWQYVLKAGSPAKVKVAAKFRKEEKASGEMLNTLKPLMSTMWATRKLDDCVVCFVGERFMVHGAHLPTEPDIPEMAMPQREESMSLMPPEREGAETEVVRTPVVATRLYLIVDNEEDLEGAGRYVEGVLIGPRLVANRDEEALHDLASAVKRHLGSSDMILDLEGVDLRGLEWLAALHKAVAKEGLQLGLLLPGSRSAEELSHTVKPLNDAFGETAPAFWGRVMYPSNLFFMDELAGLTDLLAIDLDALARYMIGLEDDDVWTDLFMPSLRHALSEALKSANDLRKGVAVFSVELLGSPSMLEHLVREGVERICVGQEEYGTVGHIVASVEKRLLLEQARRE